jgi:hypothetical protein
MVPQKDGTHYEPHGPDCQTELSQYRMASETVRLLLLHLLRLAELFLTLRHEAALLAPPVARLRFADPFPFLATHGDGLMLGEVSDG